MDKINLVYYDNYFYRNPYFIRQGLRRTLEKLGLLNYCYNPYKNKESPDYYELNRYPTIFIRGTSKNLVDIACKVTAYKASVHTENIDEEIDKNQMVFDKMFCFAESDLDKYKVPVEYMLSWADIDVFKEVHDPLFFKLCFIGLAYKREDFLDKLGDRVERIVSCVKSNNYLNNVKQLVRDINDYQYVLCPPGQAFNGMLGRVWETMACQRLCFAYLNKDTMFKSSLSFKDGKHLVYYENIDELLDKYDYYFKNIDKTKQVARQGRAEIEKNHNEELRAKEIVGKLYADIRSTFTTV